MTEVTELNSPSSGGSSEIGFPSSSSVCKDLHEHRRILSDDREGSALIKLKYDLSQAERCTVEAQEEMLQNKLRFALILNGHSKCVNFVGPCICFIASRESCNQRMKHNIVPWWRHELISFKKEPQMKNSPG